MSSTPDRTPQAKQLEEWYEDHGALGSATSSSGNPIPYITSSLTVGKHGDILLKDWQLLDDLTHFARERIPERVVHAKGGGAFGYFEVTHDITDLTIAKVFKKIGSKTPIAARFSTVAGNLGSADTARDPRGFALKFNTEDGPWDLVGNNTPIFFIRDPILFKQFIHSQKRNPVTNTRDWDAFWDFISLRPETTHQVMFLMSDRGIPDGFRHMHGFGSHTFKFINEEQNICYVKFHMKTDQGIKNIFADEATELAGSDPDYSIKDLYNNIADGDYPSWTMYIQVMCEEQSKEVAFDPFDVTKVWPHGDYPLRPVGKLVLNKNQENYFAEIEQLAFTPSNFIPGIDSSPDRMLQGRLFSYHDAHVYRLGVNYPQLPVNSVSDKRNFQRDGKATIDNQGGAPNYYPNSFGGPHANEKAKKYYVPYDVKGAVDRYDLRDEDNYSQPRNFWNKVMKDDEKTRMIENICDGLRQALPRIQKKVVANFSKVDDDFGKRLSKCLNRKSANI